GDEGAEVEFRFGEIGRGQTAVGLALRRVQTEVLEAVTREEFVPLAEFVIDANSEGVAAGAAVDDRSVVVRHTRAERQRIDARNIQTDLVEAIDAAVRAVRNDVVGEGRTQNLRISRADRLRGGEVRIVSRRQRVEYHPHSRLNAPRVGALRHQL